MGADKHIYVGAYLKLTNIYEETINYRMVCPTHGKMDGKFCSQCGAEVIKDPYNEKTKKKWHWCCKKWEDELCDTANSTPIKDAIILMPNVSMDAGQMFCTSSDDEGIANMTDDNRPDDYINDLVNHYGEYIEWLQEEKKFEVSWHFGVITYWN